MEMNFNDQFEGRPLIETLLTPTRIYVKTYKKLKGQIQAMAHITGGGLVENLPRVLPENLRAVIHAESIRTLPIFELIGTHVEREEMFRAFNMGVGMVFVVRPEDVDAVLQNSDGYLIGEIEEGKKEAVLV
jgi:phosphoribosylformylglycinamidine cyclo-ligase